MKPKNKIASFFDAVFVDFRNLKIIDKINSVVEKMNPAEKTFFHIASIVLVVSGLLLVFRVHQVFLVEVPRVGGSFTEGVIGSPRFINPILAISDSDKDLSSLIYSGLIKSDGNGGFEPDMALSYKIEEGGMIYDVVLKNNLYFHDGKEVTVDDVIFTISKTLDPIIKSQKKSSWEGVTIEKISNKELRFILSKPYAPFLESLTVGILPKHIWENASSEEFPFSEFNLSPIGSGPYKVDKITRNSGGIPTAITLSSWKRYALGQPKIKTITFKFFQNENELYEAYADKSVQSAVGLSPATAEKLKFDSDLLSQTSLPRVFGVFLNQNIAPVFLNKEVRQALEISAPKTRIVEEVLHGFGREIDGPTPTNIEDPELAKGDLVKAKELLLSSGWKENESGIMEKAIKKEKVALRFSISTSDSTELKKAAEILKEEWSKLGAEIDVKVFGSSDLSQNVIRARKYDALLFGEVVDERSDLYPFWHSSQRMDPGLNISLYTNITADKALEEIQKDPNIDPKEKREVVIREIKQDLPAVFLFSPHFLYAKAREVKNVTIENVASQNERFASINKWYIETDKVWKFLASK